MSHIVMDIVADAQQQFDCRITDYEPLGLDGEWYRENEYPVIGKPHAEAQQYTEYGTRCSSRLTIIQIFTHRDRWHPKTGIYSVIHVQSH